jgi:pentatricopeptide repeat protein
MYAKCGSIEDAQSVFNKLFTHNAVTWNAMLAGYAIHGHAKQAFEPMCEEGVEMGVVTFVSLLSTCSHAGLVDGGLVYFDSMSLVHEELIKTMSFEPNAPVRKALVGLW